MSSRESPVRPGAQSRACGAEAAAPTPAPSAWLFPRRVVPALVDSLSSPRFALQSPHDCVAPGSWSSHLRSDTVEMEFVWSSSSDTPDPAESAPKARGLKPGRGQAHCGGDPDIAWPPAWSCKKSQLPANDGVVPESACPMRRVLQGSGYPDKSTHGSNRDALRPSMITLCPERAETERFRIGTDPESDSVAPIAQGVSSDARGDDTRRRGARGTSRYVEARRRSNGARPDDKGRGRCGVALRSGKSARGPPQEGPQGRTI